MATCRRTILWVGLAAGFLANSANGAVAQQYPARPITLIVGVAAGGAVDIVSRFFAEKTSQKLGQSIVVENRSGGAGIPSVLAVKNAQPDGYTIMVLLGAIHSILPMMQSVPYDPIEDFTPISRLYSAPGYVLVPGASPANSMKDLLALGKARPEGLSFGSASPGSPGHLTGLLIQEVTGVAMRHIPYRGGGQMMTDLLAGRLDFGIATYTNFESHLGAKQVKALNIASAARWSGTPDIPTLAEDGIAGVDAENTFGIAGPKGLPASVVKILNQAFIEASRDPDLVQRLTALGVKPTASAPEDLVKMVKDETAQFAPIIKKYGIKGGN